MILINAHATYTNHQKYFFKEKENKNKIQDKIKMTEQCK